MQAGAVINCALSNDSTGVFSYSRYASINEHGSLKAEIILCPEGAYYYYSLLGLFGKIVLEFALDIGNGLF